MGKILGIDYGVKKIGLALAEKSSKLAVPWQVVVDDKNFKNLISLIKQSEIEKIVVGYPMNLDNQATKQTKEVDKFINTLAKKVNLPIIKEDERLTSQQAQKQIRSLSGKRSGRQPEDAVAAMYILQTYLDRQHG